MEQQAGYKLSFDTPQTYAQTLMRSVVPHSEESLLPAAAVDTTTTQQALQQQRQSQQQQQQQEWEVCEANRYDISGVSTDDVAHSAAELSQRSEQQLIEEWTYIAPAKKEQQTTAVNTDTAAATASATATAAAGSSTDTSSYWHRVDGSAGSVHGQAYDNGNADVATRVCAPTSQYCSVMNPYAVFTSNNSSSCDSGSSSND
jgi:hypothetical protein